MSNNNQSTDEHSNDRVQYNDQFVVIIVNAIPPYHHEINNLLALPNEFEYRFRYKKHWIPTIDNPISIARKPGLVILRDFETGKFYPLRHIYITKVLPVGEIFYIQIRVNDLVELASDDRERQQQLEEFNTLISGALMGYENSPRVDLKNLVFFGADFTYALKDPTFQGSQQDREYNRWGNIINAFGTISTMQDIDFFRLMDMKSESGDTAQVSATKAAPTRYMLKRNSTYTLQLVQKTITGRRQKGDSSVSSPRRIKLITEPEVAKIVQGDYAITGKYDIYPMIFRTADTVPNKNSFLIIQVARTDSTVPQIPPVQLPIETRATRLQIALFGTFAVTFVLAAIAFLFTDNIFQSLSIHSVTDSTINIIQKLSVLLMILTSSSLGRVGRSLTSRLELSMPIRT